MDQKPSPTSSYHVFVARVRIPSSLALLAAASVCFSQQLPFHGKVRFTGKQSRHQFSFELDWANFRASKHRTVLKKGDIYVDGKLAMGTDGQSPRREITLLKVAIDGANVVVPRALWRGLFEPPERETMGERGHVVHYFWPSLSRDAKLLQVTMLGSDGAGAYVVEWYFPKSGRPTRFVSSDEAYVVKRIKEIASASAGGAHRTPST
jgi:hypothetical protein